jgi:DNA-binding CsgD family transcriptional regulator
MSEAMRDDFDGDGYVFRDWNKSICNLLMSDDNAGQLPLLVLALGKLAPFDDWLAAVFHRGKVPTVLGYSVPDGQPDPYGEGAYLLDPFYEAFLIDIGPGCFRLADLTPDGLLKSEFYSSYYRRFAFVDEVGYLLPLTSRSTLHLSLGRAGTRDAFSSREVRRLHDAIPVVEAVGHRVWSPALAATTSGFDSDDPVSLKFEKALDNFTAASLTDRQREIVRLQLKGHSTKSIAQMLEISPGTVRNHIKSIHLRLEISSQRELFSMFIDRAFAPMSEIGD